MNKREILTIEDIDQLSPLDDMLIKEIQRKISKLNLNKSEVRILDFGCGRGRTVFKLLRLGYDAYGIDIEEEYLFNAKPLFNQYNYNDRLKLLKNNEEFPFVPEFFDIIISNQVIEHIESLSWIAGELHRISKPSGQQIHIFPSKYKIIEPHVFIPLVHWLPKSKFRLYYIYFFYAIRRNPEASKLSFQNYQYLQKYTHYRSNLELFNEFSKIGMNIKFTTINSSIVKNKIKRLKIVKLLIRCSIVASLMNFIINTFQFVILELEKN